MDEDIDDVIGVHNKHHAGDVPQNVITKGLPAGWRILTRRWGPGYWDAVILPPPGKTGWRLADPPAPTEREVIRRAVAEIGSAERFGMAQVSTAWDAVMRDVAEALATGREPEDVQTERHRRELAAVGMRTRPPWRERIARLLRRNR